MIAAGASARTSSAVMSQGTISEYTSRSAHAPRNELPVLGAEIDDDDRLDGACRRGHEDLLENGCMFGDDSTPSPAVTVFRTREMSRPSMGGRMRVHRPFYVLR